MEASPTFAIVLPVYNEEGIIESCITNIRQYLDGQLLPAPIIAVNDGSRDDTANVLAKIASKLSNIVVVTHEKNGGYGQACRTGLAAARKLGVDYALVMDADGTQEPRFIANFFTPMREGVDFIKATRYALGGRTDGVGLGRYLPSYVGNKLARLMLKLPLTDYTNGFRAIKTSLLPHINTRETGFSVLIEEVVCARKAGARFAEVPYVLTVRPEDIAGSKFIYSWKVYRNYLKHLFSAR